MVIEANQLRTPDDIPAEAATPDDGGSNQPGYTPPAPQPQPQNAPEERNEPQAWTDDKRNAIFARAKEKRQAETEPFSGDPNDPNALYGSNTDQSDMGELEKEALRRRQEHLGQITNLDQQQGQQPGKPLNGIDPTILAATVPIVVDGEQRLVTVEEALRNYQIEEAAKRRLEQAKSLLQHSQQFQRQQQPQPGQQGAEYTEPSGQDDSTGNPDDEQGLGYTSRRPANAKDLVEKIQLGSTDEALEALDEFISSAVNRAPPVDETTRVLTALEDVNAQKAIRAFAEKNPQVATNPVLQAEVSRVSYRLMAEDLLRAGYTMDQLRQAAPDAQHLTQLHKQARIQGVKGVRRVDELVDAAYHGAINEMRTLVDTAARPAAPNQAPAMQQRQQRKEGLPPQPAARRLSPAFAAPSQNRSQDQSRSAAVMKMRQARGQST